MIRVEVVADLLKRPAFSPDGQFDPAYTTALAALTDGEAAALELLIAWSAAARRSTSTAWMVARLRRRQFRRVAAKRLDAAERRELDHELAAAAGGRTKRPDALRPLCGHLHHAGLPASMIAALLRACGLEHHTSPEHHREAVQARIDRWRRGQIVSTAHVPGCLGADGNPRGVASGDLR